MGRASSRGTATGTGPAAASAQTAASSAAGGRSVDPFTQGKHVSWTLVILGIIVAVAVALRLPYVFRFEATLDGHIAYRNERLLSKLEAGGFQTLIDWFDEKSNYPHGREAGQQALPGLPILTIATHRLISAAGITVNTATLCVYFSPILASATTVAVFYFTLAAVSLPRARGSTNGMRRYIAALVAAGAQAIVPVFVSATRAGYYEERTLGILLHVLVLTFWATSLRRSPAASTSTTTLSAVAAVGVQLLCFLSWEDAWIPPLTIALHTMLLVVREQYSEDLDRAFTIFYTGCTGTLILLGARCVTGICSIEYLPLHAAFAMLRLAATVRSAHRRLGEEAYASFVWRTFVVTVVIVLLNAAALYVYRAHFQWSREMLRFFNPFEARDAHPVLASISALQPMAWGTFFMDLHLVAFLMPLGIYWCFVHPDETNLLLVTSGMMGLYAGSSMVQYLVIVTPPACALMGLAVAQFVGTQLDRLLRKSHAEAAAAASSGRVRAMQRRKVREDTELAYEKHVAFVLLCGMVFGVFFFLRHSYWAALNIYSNPSIVIPAHSPEGQRIHFDDFREAYSWLELNTPVDAKVLAWRDYGYHLTTMANRTVLTDNAHMNETEIGAVGRILVSDEETAYKALQAMGVDYVLVTFGGMVGYAEDDIAKLVWMLRLAEKAYPDEIRQSDYFAGRSLRVDRRGKSALLNSLIYKLSYLDFGRVQTDAKKPMGYDRVRHAVIGNKGFKLQHFQEVLTTEHWAVRIFKVLPLPNRRHLE